MYLSVVGIGKLIECKKYALGTLEIRLKVPKQYVNRITSLVFILLTVER